MRKRKVKRAFLLSLAGLPRENIRLAYQVARAAAMQGDGMELDLLETEKEAGLVKRVGATLGPILAMAEMLRQLGASKSAAIIEKAVRKTLDEGYRTADISTDAAANHPIPPETMALAVLTRLSR